MVNTSGVGIKLIEAVVLAGRVRFLCSRVNRFGFHPPQLVVINIKPPGCQARQELFG